MFCPANSWSGAGRSKKSFNKLQHHILQCVSQTCWGKCVCVCQHETAMCFQGAGSCNYQWVACSGSLEHSHRSTCKYMYLYKYMYDGCGACSRCVANPVWFERRLLEAMCCNHDGLERNALMPYVRHAMDSQ